MTHGRPAAKDAVGWLSVVIAVRHSVRRRAARDALAALPPALRAAAEVPDDATYPMPDWPVQTDTAPLAMLDLEAAGPAEGEPKETTKRFGRKGRRQAKKSS